MKLKFFIAFLFIAAVAYGVFSANHSEAFAPAEDFPRGALVYAQAADLPALIRLWEESDFKNEYLAGKNFGDFKNRHLALKLARWQEFSDGAGFPIDLEAVGGLADKRAAVALYDIGKLEFVFIAPVSEEIYAAAKFVRHKENFTEETLADGTQIYRAAVRADRGRQKQELIFTNVRGRFIISTSEKLLARTLANINEKSAKDRLIDEPSFKILSEKVKPNLATVWIDQTALNGDYYFKRYWLMSGAEDLRNIRAGIFDFAMEAGKLIERRRFLLDKPMSLPAIETGQAVTILSHLPADIPFYRIRAADDAALNETILNTISDRRENSDLNIASKTYSHSTYDDYADFEWRNYNYSGEKFDRAIDDTGDDEVVETRQIEFNFAAILSAAKPRIVLTFARPAVLQPAPLFIEFRRGAVVRLNSPAAFDQSAFESAIERSVAARILIAAPDARLKWETKTGNDLSRRELNLPMLGRSISYAIDGNEIILSNNADFLREIVTARNSGNERKIESPFTELAVLNLAQRENSFDRVFDELEKKKAADAFFTGSVASLLDSLSEVEKIEVGKNHSQNILEEQVTVYFRAGD